MHTSDENDIRRWSTEEPNARKVKSLVRGMREMTLDKAPLRFSNLFDVNNLPALPSHWGHWWLGLDWGMYGNDKAGNCVDAGGEHENMYWCCSTKKQIPRFTNTSLQNYSDMLVASGGSPYDPNDPSTDTGLNPIDAAAWRQSTGFLDDAGNRHKDDAFIAIANLHHAYLASFVLGVCGFGFNLPDSAEEEFAQKRPWSDTSQKPSGGHYVPLVGRNSHGMYVFITWGAYQAATPAWVAHYFMGAVGYVNREYLRVDGTTPEGFNETALDEYLASLKG